MKKGIAFTILSLVVSTVMLTAFFSLQDTPEQQRSNAIFQGVNQINTFLDQSDQFVRTVVSVESRKLMTNMTKIMKTEDDFFTDFDTSFKNCSMNGKTTLNGKTFNCRNISKEIKSLENFTSEKLLLDTEIAVENVTIYQNKSWTYYTEVEYNMSVKNKYAEWNLTRNVVAESPIRGIEDPTLAVNVSPEVSDYENTRIAFNGRISPPWGQAESILQNKTLNKEYFYHPDGHSFLDRFRHNDTPQLSDCCGLMSVIPEVNTTNPDDCNTNIDYFHVNGLDYKSEYPSANITRIDFSELDYSYQQALLYDPANGDYGLNGTTLPEEVLNYTAMTNESYIEDVPSC